MKKFFAFLLTFAMLFSLAMPAMAADEDNYTLYIDISQVADSTKEVSGIRLWAADSTSYPVFNQQMSSVSGTVYSYSVPFQITGGWFAIFYTDGTSSDYNYNITSAGNNLYTPTGTNAGTWSTYSAPTINGNTTGDVSASYTPTPEAKWGTSKDDLTNSGTFEEAIAAASTDLSITYIQLQTGLTLDYGYDIYYGDFTLDLHGNTLTVRENYALAARDSGVKITLTDTATGGAVIGENDSSAIIATGGGKLVIDAGSYTGSDAVHLANGGVAEINGGTFTGTAGNSYAVFAEETSTVTIKNGTFSGRFASVFTGGTTTITGGTFGAGQCGQIEYWGGKLDLSGYTGNGLTLSQWTGADLTVPNENILLPEGYVFKDGETTVTTLAPETVYTIAAESSEPTYTITVEKYGEGTVEVPASAAKGDTVTVTITPAEGYTLTDIYGFNAEVDDEIIFEKVNDTTYTFTMLGDNVIVVVEFCLPGTELDTIYYKGPWTNIVFEFSTSEGTSTGNAETTIVESGIYAATSIPEWSYTLHIRNLDDVSQYLYVDSIPTDGRNMYNAYTGEWETYTPSQPEETTSAEITWGSMSFTYSDEQIVQEDGTTADKGWYNDGTEKAGTVTVKNTGNTTFTAQASYESTTAEYGTFTGTFNPASSELTAGSSYTFTLELNGKPTKAIPAGTKIGEVTITINESAEG